MKKIKSWIVKLNIINIFSIFYYIFRIFPIKSNKIFCQNFTSGKGLGDSPKYIAFYLLNNSEQKYDIVWAVKKVDYTDVPKGIKLVKIYSIKYFYEMVTSKIWISNTRFALFTRKRKEQYYIQTWHSSLRLKKIEMDASERLTEYYHKVMKNDSKQIDVILSGCKFSTNIYKNAFLYNGNILEIGTPRCDMFFHDNTKIKEKIKEKYNLSEKKIILYAPTFRKNVENSTYLMDIEKLHKELGKEYYILVRSHPSEDIDFPICKEVINVSKYPDMQELLCITDILVTDYSSCCFDMLIANKPVLLLVKDLESYLNNERELYFNFKELPFYVCKTDDELIYNIKYFDVVKYEKKIKQFKDKIELFEDGNACQKICSIIEEKCYKK